jgi:lipopolysaccharide export system permease protein
MILLSFIIKHSFRHVLWRTLLNLCETARVDKVLCMNNSSRTLPTPRQKAHLWQLAKGRFPAMLHAVPLMPSLQFRYLLRQLLGPMLAAMAILLSLLWLLQSLRFLDLIINRGLGVGTFLEFTLLLLPKLLVIVLPVAVLIGLAYTLRRWQDDAETTAWLATGQTPWRLAAPVLTAAGLASLFGFWLFWGLLPATTTTFKDQQLLLRQQQGQLLLEPGSFNQLGDDLMVYLQRRTGPTQLEQLLVHDTRNPNQPVTWYARRGDVRLGPGGTPLLTLQNGLRQEVLLPKTPDQQAISNLLQFQTYTLNLLEPLSNQDMLERTPELEELTAAQLLAGKDDPELWAEWHKRWLMPLTPLALALLAMGFLLRPATRSTSTGRQLVGLSAASIGLLAGVFGLNSLASGGQSLANWGLWLLLPTTMLVAWRVRWQGLM